MGASELSDTAIQVTLARHDGRLGTLEERVTALEKTNELVADLRVELGKLQMQIKVTWILLTMVVGGLISVAFAFWSGGGSP